MVNLSEFIRAGALFMATDRPDIYTIEGATQDLTEWFSVLSGSEEDNISMGTGGFVLSKSCFDEEIEYLLTRNIITFTVFMEDHETSVFDWAQSGALTGQIDLNIPVPDDELELPDPDLQRFLDEYDEDTLD